MRIIKLGGTTVSSPNFINQFFDRISTCDESVIIVLSALSQVTNLLEKLKKAHSDQQVIINEIDDIHTHYINEIITNKQHNKVAKRVLSRIVLQLRNAIHDKSDIDILAFGEYLSTSIFSMFLRANRIQHSLKNSVEHIFLNEANEPHISKIKSACDKTEWEKINVFQGFICSDWNGNITTLSRGGSDFTATLLAECTNADCVEIWTDIDGLRSNDPRFVENTTCVMHLNYSEAAELAYFGAKILHPESVLPAQRANIPIYLKNSKNVSHKGTLIDSKESRPIIKAVASKDEIILINITSYRMLMAYGFLSQIFDVFNKYKTPIDLITTSEISVSLTIDNDKYLPEIISELERFSQIIVKKQMSIISVVGDFGKIRKSIAANMLDTISNPIEIMSYGTNRRNISVLVEDQYKTKNLNELNQIAYSFHSKQEVGRATVNSMN